MKWISCLALLPLLALTTSAPIPPQRIAVKPTQYVYYFPQTGSAPISPKKGIGMPYADCKQLAALGVRWEYNWSAQPWACAGVENVPMAWGSSVADVGGNSAWLMGFNEPDLKDQSNLSLERAAALWAQIDKLYPSRSLVAPAPSHLHPEWIADFRDAYDKLYGMLPRLNALAVHCYLPTAAECIALVQRFEDWAKAWGIGEIWVTEFSFVDAGEAQTFIHYLQADPMVTRYAWFALAYRGDETWSPPKYYQVPLVDSTGKLTTWGSLYR